MGVDVLNGICQECDKRPADFGVQSIANLVCTFAKFKHVCSDALAALSDASIDKIEQFTPQGIVNTTYGLAKLRLYNAEFMDSVSQRSTGLVHRFKPQDVSVM